MIIFIPKRLISRSAIGHHLMMLSRRVAAILVCLGPNSIENDLVFIDLFNAYGNMMQVSNSVLANNLGVFIRL